MSMVGSSFSQRKRRAIANTDETVPVGGEKPAPKEDKVLQELVASAIIRHGYPLSFFEQHIDLHMFLNPNVKLITTEVSKANCLKIYETEKAKLKHALESVPGRFCLTCDVWIDPFTIEYLCLTVNYVDSNWKLQNKFLNLVPLSSPCEGSIFQSVYDLLLEWGIEKKISTITVDSKRCGGAVHDLLRNRLSQLDGGLICNGDYFHVRCGAHFMDHMGRECFKLIQTHIGKIREGVQYVVGHEEKRLKFQEAARKVVGDGVLEPLWLDDICIWNSTYLMLDKAVKYHSAFEHVMIDDEYTGWHLTDDDWSRVEKICKLAGPLYNIANLFLGTEHPTANLYFIDVWMIGILLMEAVEDKDLEFRTLAQRLKVEFDEYWETCSTFLAFAMMFDPRFKFDFVKFSYQRLYNTGAQDRYERIYSQLDMLFKAYRENRFASEANFNSGRIGEFDKWSKEQEVNSSKSKLDLYLEEPRLQRREQFDVLSWWKENELRYPEELTLMARDILSIPITSFSKDSVFGMGYRVRDRLQGSWAHNSAEPLIAARNWLYGYQVDEEYPGGLKGIAQRFCTRNVDEDLELGLDLDSD